MTWYKLSCSKEMLAALKESTTIAAGYLPISLAFGLLLVQSGLVWYWALLMSMLMFAGSMQYIAIPLLAAGAPLWEIALTTVMVNFRHIFYGLSFPSQIIKNRFARVYSMFCITDEVYSVVGSRKDPHIEERHLLWLQFFAHLAWCSGTLIGALAGQFMPDGIQGIEFAATALFVVLAVEQANNKDNHVPMLIGLIAGMLAFVLSAGQYLLVAIVLFLSFLGAYYLVPRLKKEGCHE